MPQVASAALGRLSGAATVHRFGVGSCLPKVALEPRERLLIEARTFIERSLRQTDHGAVKPQPCEHFSLRKNPQPAQLVQEAHDSAFGLHAHALVVMGEEA